MKRGPAEYIILASFGATALFWGWLFFFGSERTYEGGSFAAVLPFVFLGIGAAAGWLLLKRRIAGAWLCAFFYGIQVLTFSLPIGGTLSINSLPTLYFRLNGDPSAPVSINVVAFVLFIVSLALLAELREQAGRSSQVSPNTSLERTRDR